MALSTTFTTYTRNGLKNSSVNKLYIIQSPGTWDPGTLELGTCDPGTWDPDTRDLGNGTLGS